jgi:hypothetical protein
MRTTTNRSVAAAPMPPGITADCLGTSEVVEQLVYVGEANKDSHAPHAVVVVYCSRRLPMKHHGQITSEITLTCSAMAITVTKKEARLGSA